MDLYFRHYLDWCSSKLRLLSLILFWIATTCTGVHSCSSIHHVFVHNTTEGLNVHVTSPGIDTFPLLVPDVRLPAECKAAGHRSNCNATAVRYREGPKELLSVYVPARGSLVVLDYEYTATLWNLTRVSLVPTPQSCNPLTVAQSAGSSHELGVLCVSDSAVTSLVLTVGSGEPTFTTLDSMATSGPIYAPLYVPSNAYCPVVGTVADTALFLDRTHAFVAAFTAAAPNVFTGMPFEFLSSACPSSGHLECYGSTSHGSAVLLRCSAGSAFTFDPCRRPLRPVANHSVSVPYPCSTWGVVAWMFPNHSMVAIFENGTATPPITVEGVSEARCVNSKDPHFVYRHWNGSVYAVRIQDGGVTTLGTSGCSWSVSSPVLCPGLDFSEHEGSFLVGFIDGRMYKVVNLSCPNGPHEVVGLPFPPDLSTSFVGPPNQHTCPCSPKAAISSSFPQPPSQLPSPDASSSSPRTSSLSPSPSSPYKAQAQLSSLTGTQLIVIGVMISGGCGAIAIIITLSVVGCRCRHRRYKRTADSIHGEETTGQPSSKSKLVTLGPVRLSIATDSSDATFELAAGVTQNESVESGLATSGSPDQTETPFSLERPEPTPVWNGMVAPRSLEQMPEWNGMETACSLEQPVPAPPELNELAYVLNTPHGSDQNMLEPTTVPMEENAVPQESSLETGHGVPIPSLSARDVVEKDAELRSEDRRNDMDSKIAALNTRA